MYVQPVELSTLDRSAQLCRAMCLSSRTSWRITHVANAEISLLKQQPDLQTRLCMISWQVTTPSPLAISRTSFRVLLALSECMVQATMQWEEMGQMSFRL